MHPNNTSQLPLFATPPDDLPQIVPITSKQIKDLTGKQFGRLTVLGYVGATGKKNLSLWHCRCDCGGFKTAYAATLVKGSVRSCGCLHREQLVARNTSHGMSGTPEYNSWAAMNNRCRNPTQTHYCRYGERGITVCESWSHSFENFYADMGPKPGPEYSIDRIDNNKGYSPDNCRWATRSEQTNNTRRNHFLEFGGERLTIQQWSKRTGIAYHNLKNRIRYGWDIEKILTTPVK